VLSFSYGEKIPEINNLKGEKIYFGSFTGSDGHLALLFLGQNIMVESTCWIKDICLFMVRKRNESGRDLGQNIPIKNVPSVACFLQLVPIS
jgi:hypothetical protein